MRVLCRRARYHVGLQAATATPLHVPFFADASRQLRIGDRPHSGFTGVAAHLQLELRRRRWAQARECHGAVRTAENDDDGTSQPKAGELLLRQAGIGGVPSAPSPHVFVAGAGVANGIAQRYCRRYRYYYYYY